MEKRWRPNPGDKPKWKDKAQTRLKAGAHAATVPRLSMTITQKKNDRLYTVQGTMESVSVYYTLTRILGADITSSLGMKTTTELCHRKCRRIQACSHNRAGIYIMGLGGGRRKLQSTYGIKMANPEQRQCGQFQWSRHCHIVYVAYKTLDSLGRPPHDFTCLN